MNRKQLTTLLVLLVCVGGLGLFLSNRKQSAWTTAEGAVGQKLLPNFPVNEIAQIRVQSADGELNLVYDDEKWRVRERWNYPANFTDINRFLHKMWDLKTVQSLQVGPSQLGRLDLLPPGEGKNSGTLVEFKDGSGKTVRSVMLGKPYVRESGDASPFGGGDFPVGRYVKPLDKESTDVRVISDPLTDIEPAADRWLSKDFFKVEKLQSITVTARDPQDSWSLYRETEEDDWRLAEPREGEALDSSKIWSVRNALSSPSFNDVVSPDTRVEITGLDEPLRAEIDTFDGLRYKVKVGRPTEEDHYHLKVSLDANLSKERIAAEDETPELKEILDAEHQARLEQLQKKLNEEKAFESWTYLVSKWTIDPLLKVRGDFLADKTAPSAAVNEAVESGLEFPLDPFQFEPPIAQPPAPPGFPEKEPEELIELDELDELEEESPRD
jgi:hypothetical protein